MGNKMDELIFCCRLFGNSSGNELAVELLTALELSYSSWCDRETGLVCHTVYCSDAADAEAVRLQLAGLLPEWRELGLEIDRVETGTIRKEDWSEVWKQYFHVIELTERLVVKPSWRDYQARPGQVIVEIDPGMSFGTGQHATTSFCLKMIDRLAEGKAARSFLDAGSGSGILSIAAWKLGYRPVYAFDYDPDTIRVAEENFAVNGIREHSIDLRVADVSGYVAPLAGGFDVVAANILGSVLLKNREVIVPLVKPGGYLILAGILIEEFEKLADAFVALGFTRLEAMTEKEWRSGLFKRG